MPTKIFVKQSDFKKICDAVAENFNNEILFYDCNDTSICENFDYYIDYNNLHLEDKKCLNIVCDQSDYCKNVLNMSTYFYILECDLYDIFKKHDKLIYVSYVVYNFIVINAKILINKPIILDPITTILSIFNLNLSTTRIGDGEVMMLNKFNILKINKNWVNNTPHSLFLSKEKSYINWLSKIVKEDNQKLLVGIQNGAYQNLNVIYQNLFWFRWYGRGDKHYTSNKIYGDCLIGRPYAYKFNVSKYYEILLSFIKNKKIIVVCNEKIFLPYIDKFYFVADSVSFIFVPGMFDSIEKNDSLNYVKKISNTISENININKNIQLCIIQFGLYSKFICDIISQFMQIIDIGEFVYKNPTYDKNFYYNIDNVLSKLNYRVFNNNKIKYSISTIKKEEFLDETEPLIIIIDKILCEDGKVDSDMETFGIHFNQKSLSDNYLNYTIKGKLKVTTNIPIKIFDGKQWLHLNSTNYYDDFEIHNLKEWRISPSTEFLNENLGMQNVEFKIYGVEFKVVEFVKRI